ncbi:PadR family transcriptional regulator [Actinomadura fulvescens]|uniref:PadR family transcriptional regulator n=1 Tax=Actinomadura fulvescens TaxID=46160 RepID=A0ABN3PY61_9ACTN
MSTRDEQSSYSTVEYLILGLVVQLEPCTSYDLKREVERTISHFWTFSHTALYQAPPQLVAAGLLTEEQETTGRRRRLYRISAAGRAELMSWLGETSAHMIERRDLALLKLFLLGPHTGASQAHAMAEAQADYHARQLAALNELMEKYRDISAYPTRLTALEFGIRLERTALDFWREMAADEAARFRADNAG